jgi:hypothetical protein
MRRHDALWRLLLALALLLWIEPATAVAQRAAAVDDAIEGVQAAALDQPRVYMNVRRNPRGPVLTTGGKEPLTAIEAFLDTGASGIMLAEDTVKQLKINTERARDGKAVQFEDVGVGGTEHFGVSEPLYVSVAHYNSNTTGEDSGAYSAPMGPIRAQIKPGGGGILQMIAPNLDIAGMPVMAGRVAVIDTKPLAEFEKLRTALYSPGDQRIPKTTRHVPLTYVSFARFTRTTPAGAQGPALAPNPMIGPDPFKPNPAVKPVVLRHVNKSANVTLLLDTGAAASIISEKVARQLGIDVRDGAIAGGAKADRFSLMIGGVGGAKNAPGTFFDGLEIPTRESRPIAYKRAPFLIMDIPVEDADGKAFTLDGVLGMNFLCASAEITGGLLGGIGKIVDSPFRYIVIDNKTGVLGLVPN